MTVTNETKNSLTMTNELKYTGETWNSATYTWNAAAGTWNQSGTVLTNESKNTLTMTNETKL